MDAAKRHRSASSMFGVAAAFGLLAILTPFVGPARASYGIIQAEQDPAQATLDCDPDAAENPGSSAGSSHHVICTVLDQNGQPFLGANVDFENETPNVNDPDDNSTRTDSGSGGPDNTCTTSNEPDSAGTCKATYDSEFEEGTATIRAWIDHDDDDTTDDSDADESRSPDDIDGTDVVESTWHQVLLVLAACRNDRPDDNVFDGTSGVDEITGTPLDDIICGRDGNDTVDALGGADRVFLGRGDDRADAGGGFDLVLGGGGRDSIAGRRGQDNLLGDRGNDRVSGGSGDDSILGRTGDDSLLGGRGEDLLIAGSGRDELSGGSGPDTLWGGSGSDECRGGPGRDSERQCER